MQKQPTEGEIYSRLLERLRLAEEAAYTIGHLYKANDDFEYGQGFLAVGEMLRMTQINTTNIATRRLRHKAGFR